MKQYQVLIFDLDDTLIDNQENVKHAFRKMIESRGLPYQEEEFKRWYQLDKQFWLDRQNGKITVPPEFMTPQELKIKWVRSMRYLQYFENKITLEEAFTLNEIYIDALTEQVIPIEGAYETLSYLSTKYEIVIATNGPSKAARKKLEKINCMEFVTSVFTSEMFGVMKPEKAFFEGIKKEVGKQRNEAYLVIGDNLKSDIEGATNMNMDSCWLKREEIELKDHHPTFTIQGLLELKTLL